MAGKFEEMLREAYRKWHYMDADERNLRAQATALQARVLLEEAYRDGAIDKQGLQGALDVIVVAVRHQQELAGQE